MPKAGCVRWPRLGCRRWPGAGPHPGRSMNDTFKSVPRALSAVSVKSHVKALDQSVLSAYVRLKGGGRGCSLDLGDCPHLWSADAAAIVARHGSALRELRLLGCKELDEATYMSISHVH